MSNWKTIETILRAMPLPHFSTLLLYGPPASGKTWAAETMGQDGPVFSVTATPDTPAAELRGFYAPSAEGIRWHDGVATLAMRAGRRLCLHEVDLFGADCLGLLYMVLDSPQSCSLTLPTGETLRPAPGFHVVCTSNVASPDELPDAIRSRLPVALHVGTPHESAFVGLPKDLQLPARTTASLADPARRIDLRSWLAFAALRPLLGLDAASVAVLGPRAEGIRDALTLGSAASDAEESNNE